jgi:hypothetical protein
VYWHALRHLVQGASVSGTTNELLRLSAVCVSRCTWALYLLGEVCVLGSCVCCLFVVPFCILQQRAGIVSACIPCIRNC